MNAIDPAIPGSYADGSLALANRTVRMLRSLTFAYAAVALLVAIPWPVPFLANVRLGLMRQVLLSSMLLPLTGLAVSWLMAWARRQAVSAPLPPPSRRWRRFSRIGLRGDPTLIGRTARGPQAILVSFLTLTACACAWLLPSAPIGAVVPPATDFMLGGIIIALTFPMLIVERTFAAMTVEAASGVIERPFLRRPDAALPEAAALRGLLLLPVIAWLAAGLVQIAAGLGVPFAPPVDTMILLLLTAIAAELCLRALGRCFLPPPDASDARAAIDSILIRMIADGIHTHSIAAPVRQHLGIDFSRSWALSYIRAATPAIVLFLLLLSWGLSGIVLIGLDQRAVYERFGAPVAVLHPGLHAVLPWPMGQVRRLEFGTVHDMTLSETTSSAGNQTAGYQKVAAEDPPPPDADRLWEQAHPAELMFLIASDSGTRQSFQVVSADVKLRYRIGLTDEDAMQAAYRVADPVAVLRGAAGRVIGAFFAGQTLDEVLGENRETMAEGLQHTLQRDLDRIGCGLQMAAVVIEAIHPPAGAAEAYHNVQAAQIQAITSITAEQGNAWASRAKAGQYATDITTQARAAAAETVGAATADLTRFTADHAAAMADGESFLLERRLSAIAGSLPKADVTIIDHRIPDADAPTVDLRPFSPATARSAGHDQE